MGYEANEQPMVRAVVYYWDTGNHASLTFVEKIILALNKYGYGDVTNIELGKQRISNGCIEDYTLRIAKKDLPTINLATELFNWINDDETTYLSLICKKNRHWVWDVTWNHSYKMPNGVRTRDYTFNQISILSSYEHLQNNDAQKAYIGLFCELSDLFKAFYGRIEDISTAVEVLELTKEKVFEHSRIQAVYWGNYFGKQYCIDIGKERIEKSCFDIMSWTSEGVFLALTDSLFDSKDHPDFKRRKRILKHLTKTHAKKIDGSR